MSPFRDASPFAISELLTLGYTLAFRGVQGSFVHSRAPGGPIALPASGICSKTRESENNMYQPEAYAVALLFMIGSMLCWGSWANTMKLTPGWPFQLFYWDYVIGIIAGSLFWGLTLGSAGGGHLSFLSNIRAADTRHIVFAILGGIVFNLANLLLVAAIEIAGLAVAFPVGIGLALVVGVLLNYFVSPMGNPVLLFGGVLLVVLAIVIDALAYRRRETTEKALSARGLQISLACGILMGIFYPLVAKAISGEHSLGPYSVAFFFALGTALCAIPVNYFLMRKPLTGGAPVSMGDYAQGRAGWHWWGVLGGFIWCTGAVLNFVASHAQIIGPAISYTIGQGATMVSAVWGVFVWKEFANAPGASRKLIPLMFLFFLVGLGAVALAPVW
jgi:glucose uptake protein